MLRNSMFVVSCSAWLPEFTLQFLCLCYCGLAGTLSVSICVFVI